MPAGTTKVSAFGYVAQVDKDGNVASAPSSGPQPSTSSTSVTPATDGPYFQTASRGLGSVATGQVTVATTATQIVAARSGRGSVKITNLGATDVFIGAAGVTTTTGDLLLGSKGASVIVPTSAALFGVVGTGTQALSFIEIY